MSAWAEKKERLTQKRARHVENIEATKVSIAEIDKKIALCDAQIAAEAKPAQ